MKKKILLLFSGGADSTLLLHLAQKLGYEVECLIFDYGQIHAKEIVFAVEICKQQNVPYQLISLNLPLKSTLMAEKQEYENVSVHHVPARNLIFVSIAAGICESQHIDTIWIGANYEDRKLAFPDCYQEWVYQLNKLLEINGSSQITVEAPLLGMQKPLITAMSETIFNINKEQIFSGYGTERQ
jgi:7-cyano-7-deazaguanine synthase